jgi:hypothetical protein
MGNASRAHHAEGLVDPKVRTKKKLLILDTPEHLDSEIDQFSNFFRLFSRFFGRGERIQSKNEAFIKYRKNSIFGQFLTILATFYE